MNDGALGATWLPFFQFFGCVGDVMLLDLAEVVLAPPSGADDVFALPSGADDDVEDDVVVFAATRGKATIDETARDGATDDNGDEEMGITVVSIVTNGTQKPLSSAFH